MKKSSLFFLCIVAVFLCEISIAEEVTFLGPKKYERTSGAPNVYTDTFSTLAGLGKLIVKNGTMNGDNRVENSLSSATIRVNGEQIFGPSDFNRQVYLLESPIDLLAQNEFFIELASNPGSYLSIEIVKDVELPPDPGVAGKQTLLGIDSDNDGVRDDVQRYIFIRYPNDKKLRLALTEIAKNYQELLPDSADPDAAYTHVTKLHRSRACLYYIQGGVRNAIDILDGLHAEILNTKERSVRYLGFSNSLAGKTSSIPQYDERKSCCSFDVDSIGGVQ